MKVHVRSRQVELDDAIRSHVERRLELGLGRLADRIGRVTVYVVDVNGPRGGEDKVCRIEVRLRPTGTVIVGDAGAEILGAIDRAADRAAQAVARALKKSRGAVRVLRAASEPESAA